MNRHIRCGKVTRSIQEIKQKTVCARGWGEGVQKLNKSDRTTNKGLGRSLLKSKGVRNPLLTLIGPY